MSCLQSRLIYNRILRDTAAVNGIGGDCALTGALSNHLQNDFMLLNTSVYYCFLKSEYIFLVVNQ